MQCLQPCLRYSQSGIYIEGGGGGFIGDLMLDATLHWDRKTLSMNT